MINRYVLYLLNLEDADVTFSTAHSSFNRAKDSIESFLQEYALKRGKKFSLVSKDELEKLKLLKKPEDQLYIRKRDTEAVIYAVVTSVGRIYNTYSIEKLGKIGISEFSFPVPTLDSNFVSTSDDEEEMNDNKDTRDKKRKEKEEIKTVNLVDNYQHGCHVSFISELKSVLSQGNKLKRSQSVVSHNTQNDEKEADTKEKFISALIEGKKKLRNVQ